MSAENVQLIQSLYDAFKKGDVKAVVGSLDPNIDWNEAENFVYADRNPYRGSEAVLMGVFLRLGSQWDKFTVTPERILDAGDTVVVLGTYTGTYLRTGKKVKAQMVHVWDIRDGKAVKFQGYTDTKQFTEAVS